MCTEKWHATRHGTQLYLGVSGDVVADKCQNLHDHMLCHTDNIGTCSKNAILKAEISLALSGLSAQTSAAQSHAPCMKSYSQLDPFTRKKLDTLATCDFCNSDASLGGGLEIYMI